jgi:diaminohydroxyphosphoribosylaminopyrimidine deaminase / 5-amino-6-(5-phosphoribosylamino)uracil reductase
MDAGRIEQEALALSQSMFTEFDHRMMRRALELAALGQYTTHPNPRVGCVIVQGDAIVGEGWHRKWGEAHAEPLALAAAGASAQGATVYVTLEPHSYQSRTPPCTDALIRAGVKRVVCGAIDSNAKVAGNGLRQLRQAGIEVEHGLLEAEVHSLNRGFDKRMQTGLPRVITKIAASLDGRIALANGESRWITGEASRADVHRLRASSSAVLTGIETVLADDPQLTVRDSSIDLAGRVPLRVVVDTRLRMPVNARMLREQGDTIVFAGEGADHQQSAQRLSRADALREAGAQVQFVKLADHGHVDLRAVLADLGRQMCNDVLVEAGTTLSGRLIQDGLVDELIVYVAPKILGPDARPMAQLPTVSELEHALSFILIGSERLGDDVKLIYRPNSS